MLFPTVEFAVFFPIVLFLSWALMTRQATWKVFILAASYVFYGAADPKFCLLLGAITVGNQVAAKLIAGTDDAERKKWILRVAVGLDLLTLGFFKYYGFFTDDVGDVLDSIGLGMPLPLLSVALPIGISFYTFQAITYVVDVKRKDVEPPPRRDGAPVDVDDVGDRLERGEGDADRQCNLEQRDRWVQAHRTQRVHQRAGKEPGVLEVAEHADVADHRGGE